MATAPEAVSHAHKKAKPNYRRIVLRLPDLDHTKLAVLNSLTSPASRRVYKYAIEKFPSIIMWKHHPKDVSMLPLISHRCG
jgi:hypothetical protein